MHPLSLSTVTDWREALGIWTPRSIDTHCPHCSRAVNFALESHYWDSARSTMAASARCSGCGKRVSIWVVEPNQANEVNPKTAAGLCIYPGNQKAHRPIQGSDLLPAKLRQAYSEAVQVYNAKVWSATTTLCRRTLEGMVLHLSGVQGANGTTLAQMLRDLPEKVDLGAPITSLANSVRLGGNMGAHFDMDAEPDQELAKTMLDLLEYLLEYFYTIPRLITQAQAVLDKHT